MKRIWVLGISVLLLLATLSGCGEKFYYDYNMKDYVTVGEYSNKVDRTSLDYFSAIDEFYNSVFGSDLAVETEEGLIEDGDLANIDYEGKLDGVAFEGGTAKNYDLKIGSGSFIPGFEDGLIGVEIGTTKDIELTFPANYHSADLAGKQVVFTVKVNYATKYPDPIEADARKYGFESLKDYEKQADEYGVKSCLFQNVYDVTEVKNYPTAEEEELHSGMMEYYEQSCAAQGMTVEQLASANGYTLEQFEQVIKEQIIKPFMKRDLVAYYILQINDQKLTTEDIDATINRIKEKNEEDLETLAYTQLEYEQEAAFEKAKNILYSQAEIIN